MQTDRQTDMQTDRQTDRQTCSPLMTVPFSAPYSLPVCLIRKNEGGRWILIALHAYASKIASLIAVFRTSKAANRGMTPCTSAQPQRGPALRLSSSQHVSPGPALTLRLRGGISGRRRKCSGLRKGGSERRREKYLLRKKEQRLRAMKEMNNPVEEQSESADDELQENMTELAGEMRGCDNCLPESDIEEEDGEESCGNEDNEERCRQIGKQEDRCGGDRGREGGGRQTDRQRAGEGGRESDREKETGRERNKDGRDIDENGALQAARDQGDKEMEFALLLRLGELRLARR
eukprot:768402-Hanusia_phi.AAC.4